MARPLANTFYESRSLRMFSILMASFLGITLAGCASSKSSVPSYSSSSVNADQFTEGVKTLPASEIKQVNWQEPAAIDSVQSTLPSIPPEALDQSAASVDQLVYLALAQNPRLQALSQELTASQFRVAHIDKLPDPTIGANIFAAPIETAAGSQRANLTLMQRIPWLERLDAQAQQAIIESLAIEQVYEAERLKITADIRSLSYRLFVLEKQIEVNLANDELLQSLIQIANARITAGQASQGDVLLGTLEISRLKEQRLTLNQQVESARSDLNRLIGRPAEHSVATISNLDVVLPDWSHDQLRQIATEQQPDIVAAVLRTEASRWGVEVARLQRRPDFSLSASWYAMDDNRPPSNVVTVGQDAWAVGVQMSIPIWHEKYDAIEQEANAKHFATHATVEDTINRYDALLRDLWEQAKSASETANLYQNTILPLAEQTLKADQQAYSTGTVEFDRVVSDLRNILTLQLEYHRAKGRLATALARIQQAAGADLPLEKNQKPFQP